MGCGDSITSTPMKIENEEDKIRNNNRNEFLKFISHVEGLNTEEIKDYTGKSIKEYNFYSEEDVYQLIDAIVQTQKAKNKQLANL